MTPHFANLPPHIRPGEKRAVFRKVKNYVPMSPGRCRMETNLNHRHHLFLSYIRCGAAISLTAQGAAYA